MKTKKFNKKLVLNKKTVSNLDNNEMGVVYGDGWMTPLCPPTDPHLCESIDICKFPT